jgi:hypothetical protein
MLENMSAIASHVCEHIKHIKQPHIKQPGIPSLVGFHSIPSLPQFHLHILPVSRINSANVKTLKHIQSFTTSFFIKLSAVINFLQQSILDDVRIKISAAADDYVRGRADTTIECHLCEKYTSDRSDGTIQKRIVDYREHQRMCRGAVVNAVDDEKKKMKRRKGNCLLQWDLRDELGGVW